MQIVQRKKAARRPSLRTRLMFVLRRIRGQDWRWFDHPEMGERIRKAEADRAKGRVDKFDSREAALAHLDRLAWRL